MRPFRTVVSARIPLTAPSVILVPVVIPALHAPQHNIKCQMSAMNAHQPSQIVNLAQPVQIARSAKAHLH